MFSPAKQSGLEEGSILVRDKLMKLRKFCSESQGSNQRLGDRGDGQQRGGGGRGPGRRLLPHPGLAPPPPHPHAGGGLDTPLPLLLSSVLPVTALYLFYLDIFDNRRINPRQKVMR